MGKNEFLCQLRNCLSGKLPPFEVEEHISYYDNYISAKVRQGMSEEQVVMELSSPAFIAKSILSAAAAKEGYQEEDLGERRKNDWNENSSFRPVSIPLWLKITFVFMIIILILILLMKLFIMVIPILIPMALLIYLFKMLREK